MWPSLAVASSSEWPFQLVVAVAYQPSDRASHCHLTSLTLRFCRFLRLFWFSFTPWNLSHAARAVSDEGVRQSDLWHFLLPLGGRSPIWFAYAVLWFPHLINNTRKIEGRSCVEWVRPVGVVSWLIAGKLLFYQQCPNKIIRKKCVRCSMFSRNSTECLKYMEHPYGVLPRENQSIQYIYP